VITGAHVIIYSTDPEADRAFFRDVLGFSFVDAGYGWLIFALPPTEVAVHPSADDDQRALYFMCDDLNAEIAALAKKGVVCGPVHTERWGVTTKVWLPSGGQIGLYQPTHVTAIHVATS
jgi:catechol 2,3-dioxygenase-like lactoylglutathione lyase family enzyme